MKEEWKTIPDWDLYEISNLGRLRGKDRIVNNHGGPYVRKSKLLKPAKDKYGYYTFCFNQNGKKKNIKIHRLVAECFIPNPENKPCVNHIDNNPSNNRVDNLELCTHQENTDWMITQGRFDRTPEWLDNLHKSQESTYKAVKGTNIATGETLYFNKLNSVNEMGFQPSCVCNCCSNKNGITQHHGYTWEYISQEEYETAIKNTSAPQEISHRNAKVYLTRKVQNITTGEIFNSVKEAKEKYGLARMNIKRAIQKGWKIQGCEWRYLSEKRDNAQLIDAQKSKEIERESKDKGGINSSESA